MRRVLMSLAVVSLLASTAYAQQAQPQPSGRPCSPRMEALDQLEAEFGERSIGVGATPSGNVVELTVSPEGSWSLIMTNGKGIACLIGTGDGWTWRDHKKPETGS